jgi:drug/metabolite transporter (DMT)-like permease
VVMFSRRIPWPRHFRAWLPLLLLGLINIAIPFFLISWGEQSIDSAVASILDATVPLFTIFRDDVGGSAVAGRDWIRLGFRHGLLPDSRNRAHPHTMVTYLFPIGGVLLGVTFLHEQLTWQMIAGASLIIASLAVANLAPKKQALREKQRVEQGRSIA